MSNSNTSSEIDVEPTESVAQNDAEALEKELNLNTQLIGEGLDHEDHGAAIQALRDFLDPENPPKSVHMTVRDEGGVQPAFFMNDDIDVKPQTDMMGHLANHLKEVSDLLGLSPAAVAKVSADVVDTWNERDE